MTVKVREGEKLQCGHGSDAVETHSGARASWTRSQSFNAATAVTPWRREIEATYGLGHDKLQCGHGSDAVETGPD